MAGGVVGQREAVREDLLPNLLFEEREAAFHQTAVETDPVHHADQVGRGGRAKDDIVRAHRDLLGGFGLVALQQEG
jgi:hypothetical protein